MNNVKNGITYSFNRESNELSMGGCQERDSDFEETVSGLQVEHYKDFDP